MDNTDSRVTFVSENPIINTQIVALIKKFAKIKKIFIKFHLDLGVVNTAPTNSLDVSLDNAIPTLGDTDIMWT